MSTPTTSGATIDKDLDKDDVDPSDTSSQSHGADAHDADDAQDAGATSAGATGNDDPGSIIPDDDEFDDDAADPADDDSRGKGKGGAGKSGKDAADDELIARAVEEAGFTEDEARAMSAGQLNAAMSAFDRRLAKLARKDDAADHAAGAPDKGKPAGGTQDAGAGKPGADDAEFELKLDADKFDPEIVDAFNGVVGHFKAQVEQLKVSVKELIDRNTQAEKSVQQHRFDGMIRNLGKDWAPLFGEADADPKSKTAKNRAQVQSEMEALRAGRAQLGLPVLSESVLFERALRSVFGDKHQSLARQHVQDQLRNRRGQFTGRPAGRRFSDRSTSPEKAAIRAVKSKLDEFGAGDEDGDGLE